MFVLLAVFLQKLLNEMKFRSHIFSAIFILGAFLCSQAQVVNSINQDNIKKNLPKAQKTATAKAPLPVDPQRENRHHDHLLQNGRHSASLRAAKRLDQS